MSAKNLKNVVSVEILDAVVLSVMTSNNPISWIISAIKIGIYLAYITARIKMVELEQQIAKQEKEIENEQNDQTDVDSVFT